MASNGRTINYGTSAFTRPSTVCPYGAGNSNTKNGSIKPSTVKVNKPWKKATDRGY